MTTDVIPELRNEVLASKKFLQWRTYPKSKPSLGRGQDFIYKGEKYTNLVVDEKHFTPSELAKAWGVSPQTIRELFKKEEGVLKIGSNGNRNRRGYKSLRIPESVAERIHMRLSAGC
jgi:hypothetical protein